MAASRTQTKAAHRSVMNEADEGIEVMTAVGKESLHQGNRIQNGVLEYYGALTNRVVVLRGKRPKLCRPSLMCVVMTIIGIPQKCEWPRRYGPKIKLN